MWAEACAMLERAEQMQRRFFRPGGFEAAAWEPPLDLFETADGLRIVVAVPGVKAEDLGVRIDGGVMAITGRRHLPALPATANIIRLEIPYGRFERRVRLPAGHFELGRAEIADGCLSIELSRRR
jgi:HSP20 family molecular chaperone IbpA